MTGGAWCGLGAAVLTAVAVTLLGPGTASRRLQAAGLGAPPRPGPPRPRRAPPVLRLAQGLAAATCAGFAVAAATGSLPAGAVAGVGGLLGGLALRLRGASRRAHARREIALEALTACTGELRAGRPPAEALRIVVAGLRSPVSAGPVGATRGSQAAPELAAILERAATAAEVGADPAGPVAAVLHTTAPPGLEPLRALAAGWTVSATTGASLAVVLDGVVRGLRSEEAARRRAQAVLAGARSTAVLLAGLPLLVLAGGQALGAHPLRVLATPLGAACLAAGLPLLALGVVWSAAIARSALAPR